VYESVAGSYSPISSSAWTCWSPDHDVDVVDEEEAAGEPLVGAGDRDRILAHDVTLRPPPAHQGTQALDLRAGRRSAVGEAGAARFDHRSPLLYR
jgi:hypothetical protein